MDEWYHYLILPGSLLLLQVVIVSIPGWLKKKANTTRESNSTIVKIIKQWYD